MECVEPIVVLASTLIHWQTLPADSVELQSLQTVRYLLDFQLYSLQLLAVTLFVVLAALVLLLLALLSQLLLALSFLVLDQVPCWRFELADIHIPGG